MAVAMTPVQTANGKPLTWANPTQITIAPAMFNYDIDKGIAPAFSPLSPAEITLLHAAAHVWELIANVHFIFVDDTPPETFAPQPVPDIRVGLSDLSAGLAKPSLNFVGNTIIHWNAKNQLMPDTTVSIENPAEHPVTALGDGDLGYKGTSTTMFEAMIHELGHALGLDHNPNDPNSIMNPVIGKNNPLPDYQDIAALQSLYGAPTGPLNISIPETQVLAGLFNSAMG